MTGAEFQKADLIAVCKNKKQKRKQRGKKTLSVTVPGSKSWKEDGSKGRKGKGYDGQVSVMAGRTSLRNSKSYSPTRLMIFSMKVSHTVPIYPQICPLLVSRMLLLW